MDLIDVVLLYVDADGLKAVNDDFGHEAGDTLLQALARLMRETFREDDLIARMGGDEFCVLGTTTGEGDAIVQRLQQRIARFNAGENAASFRLSASVGVEIIAHDSDVPIGQSLRAADERMYGQKRRHRLPRAVGRPSDGAAWRAPVISSILEIWKKRPSSKVSRRSPTRSASTCFVPSWFAAGSA